MSELKASPITAAGKSSSNFITLHQAQLLAFSQLCPLRTLNVTAQYAKLFTLHSESGFHSASL